MCLISGQYPVAVITHVDVVTTQRVEILISTLKVTGISEIFKVANITTTKEELDLSHRHSLISLLDRCMTDSDENAKFKHHQQEDMEEQKREEERAEIVSYTYPTHEGTDQCVPMPEWHAC